jgi:adenosylcobinamide-phosphate synthase
MLLLSIVTALVLDHLLGEPKRFHPLIGFGWLANNLERLLRRPGKGEKKISIDQGFPVPGGLSSGNQRLMGLAGWLVLAPMLTALLYWLLSPIINAGEIGLFLVGTLVLYFSIGCRSLAEHARSVAAPLSKQPFSSDDLDCARQQLSRMVSRETADLDKESVAKATVESVLENANDAILAPIFWFVVAGIPGVLLYRFTNTLDAMWGYKNRRYRYFGWVAARMDDVLNWLPARCCALSYALVGNFAPAIRCWQQQARLCDSPNAGPVMSSGAGAMGICLGGRACYHGEVVIKPQLGEGRIANCDDIAGAIQLVQRTVVLWIAVVVLIQLCLWL